MIDSEWINKLIDLEFDRDKISDMEYMVMSMQSQLRELLTDIDRLRDEQQWMPLLKVWHYLYEQEIIAYCMDTGEVTRATIKAERVWRWDGSTWNGIGEELVNASHYLPMPRTAIGEAEIR